MSFPLTLSIPVQSDFQGFNGTVYLAPPPYSNGLLSKEGEGSLTGLSQEFSHVTQTHTQTDQGRSPVQGWAYRQVSINVFLVCFAAGSTEAGLPAVDLLD